MIRFERIPEPANFQADARVPGTDWLRTHPDAKRPKDLWTAFKSELADGFRSLCAYSALYEPVGTVDHFVSWNQDPTLAYEWSNYRYCAGWINSSKRHLRAERLIDPFEVADGTFEILLPSLQMQVSERVTGEAREKAQFVLDRLHLRDDERVVRQRREWYRMFQDGEVTLEGLRSKAPLIARAIEALDDGTTGADEGE